MKIEQTTYDKFIINRLEGQLLFVSNGDATMSVHPIGGGIQSAYTLFVEDGIREDVFYERGRALIRVESIEHLKRLEEEDKISKTQTNLYILTIRDTDYITHKSKLYRRNSADLLIDGISFTEIGVK